MTRVRPSLSPRHRGALDRFVAGVRLVSRLCGYVAAGLIALGVVVVCHMVFVRYVLNQHTIWQTDFVTYSLIAATFVGSPYVLMTRGHVNVDVLPLYAGPRWRWWLALFAAAVTLAFSVTLAVLTFHSGSRPGTTAGCPTPCGGRGCGSRIRRCRSGWAS